MAQQNKRVLLIDADLRRPSLHKAFGVRADVGLSSVLGGIADANDVIQPTLQPNLFLMPSGPLPPHPAELLGSRMMQDLLLQWRQDYDHVIIDTPPVLSVTDAVMISVLADAVILVIRAGKTRSAAVRRASDLLQHTDINLMGIVVNAADLSSPDYYYYGTGYSYYNERTSKKRKRSSEVETVV
jgi:capsular exopolysaccharide synthesis family protein